VKEESKLPGLILFNNMCNSSDDDIVIEDRYPDPSSDDDIQFIGMSGSRQGGHDDEVEIVAVSKSKSAMAIPKTPPCNPN
jgi:hypothetical protein